MKNNIISSNLGFLLFLKRNFYYLSELKNWYRFKGVIILFLCLFQNVYSQNITQIVRGNVLDSDTRSPLPHANILVKTTDPLIGTTTDLNGVFRIDNVPIGRHDIQVSYMGYETKVIPELLIISSKEIVLEVELKEQILITESVIVSAYTKKDKPLNTMSMVSARTFSAEEARRYAGSLDDPARVAASFAGITTENTRDNTIIIRGNSPKGLLWRLEGVEIPNPSHFANLQTFGGGGISALSSLVVGHSDFFTAAFPGEYGNATSGVFDVKLRLGNNERYEHAFQLGTQGIDFSSEGPLGKDFGASFLFNYRYSTMGLVKEIFPEDLKNFIPVYQDLCFNINLPTEKLGVFSVWGLASADESSFPAKEDTSLWEITLDRYDNIVTQRIGGLGFNHKYIFKETAWLNTSFALTGDNMNYEDDILDSDLTRHDYNNINVSSYKYTFTSVYNHKFSAKHSNRSGFILNNMHYDVDIQYAPVIGQDLISIAEETGYSNLVQFFSQSKFSITQRLLMNTGVHCLYFDLNQEMIIEPRIGLIYNLDNEKSVSLAYGKHSRIEPLTLYYTKVFDGMNYTEPNRDLKLSKAHHMVFAFDMSINPNLRLKIEPYVQYLNDVPVIPDSNYSVLNLEAEWYYFDQELINTGTGQNMGIDFTLERFLNKGYYYLFTASFFDSKYSGDDKIEHSTRFNSRYVVNFIYGKEWMVGEQNNKILGVNFKINFLGGRRSTPINQDASALAEDVVYDYSRIFEKKEPNKFYVNIAVNYRISKKNYAGIWAFQMGNLFLAKENYGYFYNYNTKTVEPWELTVPVPILSYKIEF